MSDSVVTLLAVLAGALLTPLTQGIGYLVRRHFENGDQRCAERRQALVQLQEAILELVQAEESFVAAAERERALIHQQIGTAKRRIRLLAAQVGDDTLWSMVNTPHPEQFDQVIQLGRYGEPGDIYDTWNQRIRELFAAST